MLPPEMNDEDFAPKFKFNIARLKADSALVPN